MSGRARREHSQPMAVWIERHERVPEVHLRRRLEDRQAALGPRGMRRAHAVRALDCEAELAASVVGWRWRLDASFYPKPELEARAQREQGEGRRSLHGLLP